MVTRIRRVVAGLLVLACALVLQGCLGEIRITSFSPASGSQGESVWVNIDGAYFGNSHTELIIDGVDEFNQSFSADIAVVGHGHDSNFDTHISTELYIKPSALLGQHKITLYRPRNGHSWEASESHVIDFEVTCGGCPPAPVLSAVQVTVDSSPSGARFLTPGKSAVLRFYGKNLNYDRVDPSDNHPIISFSSPGVNPVPAHILVHTENGIQYFDLPVTVDAYASAGLYYVNVETAGGRSQQQSVEVVAPNPLPPPGPIPVLHQVTPSDVAVGVDVLIKCEGSGFGTHREVITDPAIPVTPYDVSGADPDHVVVAKITPGDEDPIKIQVKNLDTGQVSQITDDIRIFPHAVTTLPAPKNSDSNGVHRGSSYNLQIGGVYADARDHLQPVADVSWRGVPGLAFSNTTSSGPPTSVSVHIVAGAATPLTGDEATNLTITNLSGESYPFAFYVLP